MNPIRRRNCRTKDVISAADDFLARADRQRGAFPRPHIEVNIARAPVARVHAKVVAVDGITIEVEAIVKTVGSVEDRLATQQCLPARVDMVIRVDGWIIAEEHEIIGVSTIGKAAIRHCSQALSNGGEPTLRPLP